MTVSRRWHKAMLAEVSRGNQPSNTYAPCGACSTVFQLSVGQAEMARYVAGGGIDSGDGEPERYEPICQACRKRVASGGMKDSRTSRFGSISSNDMSQLRAKA
jgi:hypothetical protein